MTQHTVNHTVYNSMDEYGASQRSPIESLSSNPYEYAQLVNIVKSHFPDMTNEDVNDFLRKLKNEGCCYVAMINSLFDEFIHTPTQFKEIFGFNMISEDGTLNYNHVLVDLYCKMDNHNRRHFLFFTWDTYSKNEDKVLYTKENGKREWRNKPYGNTDIQMKYRWETYCKQYRIKVNVKIMLFVTPKNYKKHAQKGSVCILCSNFTLYDDNGTSTHIKGGHFMVITDVTSDKKYVVSSWGKRYTLDPNDIKGFLNYQVIQYKKRG